jgi:hypothetical protein
VRATPSASRQGSLWLALAVASGLALIASDGRADDQAEAVKLFDKGRALMQSASTLDEGCRTLEDSLKLWNRGDTVLNLALCHRRQGKTATAWAEFEKALTQGMKVGFPEAIVEARKERAELEAILSTLTVTVPPATTALEGLTIEVGGQPFPIERWNTTFVIDPGAVRVAAHAKGRTAFDVTVNVGTHKDAKTVVVLLEVEPPLPPPPPPPPRAAPPPPRPVWPWVVGGTGVALGAGAVASEILSRNAHDELNAKCGTSRQFCPPGFDYHPARTGEVLGFGLFVGLGISSLVALGAAGVGLGVSSRPQQPSTSLVLSPTGVGFAF